MEDQTLPRQQHAWDALAVAFGSLKRPLSGGRREAAARREARMMVYSPPVWDRITKYLYQQERTKWEKVQTEALELEAQALDVLEARIKSNPVMCLEAQSDLSLSRSQFRKARTKLGALGDKPLSSFQAGQTAGNHQGAIADMKSMLMRPSVPRDLSTATETELKRLETYTRVRNARKTVRKRIRAVGGQA